MQVKLVSVNNCCRESCMRMSELKQIHDEVSGGVAGSSSGDSLARPLPCAGLLAFEERKTAGRSGVMYHDDGGNINTSSALL